MSFQYFVVLFIVLAVIVWQWIAYRANENRIRRIKNLFPKDNNCYVVKIGDETIIKSDSETGEFKETLSDINLYLGKNKNKAFDYHILKEIADRNSKSLEEEVDTMLSTPLYLGLIATIFGIAFGVVFFAWKDLANLISGTNMDPEGIKILLTDVGIAMVASLCGVFFTKQSTSHHNKARTIMDNNKNRFLTWIQSDLMSKLSDDITGALIKMTEDLNNFNSSFAQNTQELKETLRTVNQSYEGQVKLLEAIDKIKINKIAKANIEVYDRLQNCTEELENLFTILADSESYISKVVELNNNIGSVEERTRLFEELGNYFKNEVEFVRDRQGMMRQQMSSLDSVLQDALANMGDSLTSSLQNLTVVFQNQNQHIQQLIEEQQQSLAQNLQLQQIAINEKIGQISNPFEGVKEIFAEGLNNIKEAFAIQNTAIREMLDGQTKAVETAINTQQEIVLKKLQEAPGQLQSIKDLATAIEKLNNSISSQNNKTDINTPNKHEKSLWEKCKNDYVHMCAYGSFAVLLALLVLQLIK